MQAWAEAGGSATPALGRLPCAGNDPVRLAKAIDQQFVDPPPVQIDDFDGPAL